MQGNQMNCTRKDYFEGYLAAKNTKKFGFLFQKFCIYQKKAVLL